MTSRSRRNGFALMAALWLIVIIGITGYGLSVQSRTRRLAVANALERAQADAAAEGALETARAIMQNRLLHPLDARVSSLTDAMLDPWSDLSFAGLDTLHFGEGRAVLSVYDAGERLNVNRATELELRRLFAALPLDDGVAERLAQRIMDWRDADDHPRARGAERDEYLNAGARVLPSNAEFASVEELLDVAGVTPELYTRFARHLTVLGEGRININKAPPPVLHALPGMSDEAVGAITRAQATGKRFRSLEELTKELSSGARAALVEAAVDLMPRLAFESQEVIAESNGWVEGSPVHVRAEALFQRGGEAMFTAWRRSGL
jgi:general secretion pathway protein K